MSTTLDSNNDSGVTIRAILLGVVLVAIISVGGSYSLWVVDSSEITWSYFPNGVGFPIICLVLVNALLRKYCASIALRPAEILIVTIMGLVVTGLPVFLVGFLIAIPSSPHYGASPENQWGSNIIPYLPEWLIPTNEGMAMTWFYEGLPYGEPVPWHTLLHAWVMPMFWWMSFVVVLFFVCYCLVAIFRKQWVERERLAFPLTEIPLALVATDGRSLPPVFRSYVFWAGAAIPLGIILWNIGSYFFHFVPKISSHYPLVLAHGFPPLNIHLYFPVVGFLYFVNLQVSFSLWFFFVIALIQEGIFNRFGLGITEGDVFVWGLPTTSWQCWGAFVFMVIGGFWVARDHIADVVRKAVWPSCPVDDTKELLSYKLSLWGTLLGILFMVFWLEQAGLSYFEATFFLFFVLVAYLGITRLVIQGGIYYVTTPVVSQAMTMSTLGTASFTPHGLAGLGLTYSFFGDVQSILMPSVAHAAKLKDSFTLGRKGLLFSIGFAVVMGLVLSAGYIFFKAYTEGAANFNAWKFTLSHGAGVMTFSSVVGKISNPVGPDLQKLNFFGIGAGVMSLLTLLYYKVSWWPIHPIGFTVSAVWMIRNQAAAIFMAWLSKTLIMRFGGIELYRKASPFFVGLVVGHFLGVGFSFIVDFIFFHGNGHPIDHRG